MHTQARPDDHDIEGRLPTLNGGPAPDGQAIPARAPQKPVHPATEWLQALARAVQQFHTYPPTSPMCQNAVEGCVRTLAATGEGFEFRVAPRDVILDDQPVGRGTVIEIELARRLHAAAIAQVIIEPTVSPRELSRFCEDLIRCSERAAAGLSLIDRLGEHGIERIALRPAYRPEVLPIPALTAPVEDLVRHERVRRDELFAKSGRTDHLYPPDKGWVRVDPSASFDTLSLVDLALLAGDPASLAGMLTRLTDDASAGASGDALSQRFSDVALLFSAMDPRVARAMFARLARAVLDLDPDRRQALMRKTILPGLLDGRIDGMVLKDFPDLDLAESLCLLLDLEAAAPEVIPAALARLDLPDERRDAVVPLLEERIQSRVSSSAPADTSVYTHARKLLHVDRERARNVAEFAAFDLALDAAARGTLVGVKDGIAATDPELIRLECLWQLTRIEPNPETVQRFVKCARPLLEALEAGGRVELFAAWTGRYRELADDLHESRPDVADTLRAALSSLCTPERADRILALAEDSDELKRLAGDLVKALGEALAPSLLQAAHGPHARAASQLLCDHAALVAPAVVACVPQADAAMQRVIARVLGLAGAGYETPLGTLLRASDEHTVREALRALARLGTHAAATLVAAEVLQARAWVAAAAEQTLWHFPKDEVERQVGAILSQREFVLRQPDAASRLLDRAPRHNGATTMLKSLEGLRYRFWSPAVARVGRKAHALLAG